jgi:hypothetical protein
MAASVAPASAITASTAGLNASALMGSSTRCQEYLGA